ncbi:MAG: 2-C-methyl-D-erythritol 4-phosphate cytidylyltransferase [Planctomycetota bacterium]|nr:2-C-methyl-D-erythritol 4-phosphate cytidylyltransferase [Planctomycetota bacterium]
MKDIAIILAAAGKSTRFRDPFFKKVFTLASGKPVWQHSAQLFAEHPRVAQIIMAISPEDKELVQEKYSGNLSMLGVEIVLGGDERYHSIRNALERVRSEIKLIGVHDAARPCLTKQSFDAVIAAADRTGAAILASPIRGTVKRCNNQDQISETVPRDGLWEAQTPQLFQANILKSAYAKMRGKPTDDSQVVEQSGVPVVCVEGPETNIKITTKEDLKIAEAFLKVPQRTRDNPFF